MSCASLHCISLHLRGGLSYTQPVLVFRMLGEFQVWKYFGLFFLFVAGLYEEACFVRFGGYNGCFGLAWLL